MYKEYLKKHVFEEIERLKLSNIDLAAKLNVSLPTWYKYKNDLDLPLDKLVILLDMLNKRIMIVPKDC